MGKSTAKLLALAGPALAPRFDGEPPALLAGQLGGSLWELLRTRNGFYAFESALHVLPLGGAGEQSLERWNTWALWRERYQDLAEDCVFFAEDLFGGQFCIDRKQQCIASFDPETGERTQLAATLEAWARTLLADYAVLTGQPLAHTWQQRHGALPPGQRLLPKIPFVAGGAYELDNLYAADAVKGMRFRGDLAMQIRDLPDGAQIEFNVID